MRLSAGALLIHYGNQWKQNRRGENPLCGSDRKMKIIVDAFGGDNAPLEILKGCEMAIKKYDDLEILLVGSTEKINECAKENSISLKKMEILEAPDVISMEEHPNELRKSKKNSSLAVALRALAEDKGDGFVGAGSTGATLMGATTIVGRIKGVKRPAIAPVMPKMDGFFMLCDSGANADCRPEMLVQFAKMGSIYMEKVMGVKNPTVGLVNIGVEEEKGNQMSKKAFGLMKEQKVFNFAGNVEAREIPTGDVDVIACDGFDGNIILKYTEGLASALTGVLKEELLGGGLKEKIGALLIKPALKRFKGRLDADEHGGAPLLGVNGAMVKAHGSSNARAFKNAIRQARTMVVGDVAGLIRTEVEKLTPEA